MGKGKVKVMDSKKGYDLAAGEYDKKEAYLNSFEKNKLVSLLPKIEGWRVLDVGAGTGRLSLTLRKMGAEVTALDLSEKMLQRLNKKDRSIKTVVGDAEDLPFNQEQFDLITAAFLIVHFKDPRRFFDEVYRVLKNDGFLLVTNINQKDPPKIQTSEGGIVIESFYHRPDKVKEILESLAFSIEQELLIEEGGVWVNQIILAKK